MNDDDDSVVADSKDAMDPCDRYESVGIAASEAVEIKDECVEERGETEGDELQLTEDLSAVEKRPILCLLPGLDTFLRLDRAGYTLVIPSVRPMSPSTKIVLFLTKGLHRRKIAIIPSAAPKSIASQGISSMQLGDWNQNRMCETTFEDFARSTCSTNEARSSERI